jgi:hypothetical protein
VDLDGWCALGHDARLAACARIASSAGARFVELRAAEIPSATFEARGREMVLVPGGATQLGWDGAPVRLDAEARAAWDAQAAKRGSFETFLRPFLGPRRTVTLAPFLIELSPTAVAELFDPYAVGDPEIELRARIAGEGLRLPTSDEWEHAARAGASSVFRWGDEWPDGVPYGRGTSFRAHTERNRLGLRFPSSPYEVEVVAERDHVRAGDGGCAICGAAPAPEAWYSFALAFRWPRALWEDDVVELFESARVRRALGPIDLG